MTSSVADLLISGLREAGTPRLFGVPGGGSTRKLLEAARVQGLSVVLCHLESAAAIMAAVTGELTGAPGAVLASRGPGAASLAHGVAYALLDRAPLILLTDRDPAPEEGVTVHQRLDHTALLSSFVKASLVLVPASAVQQMTRALQLALTDPRGPVHLDLSGDVAGSRAPSFTASDVLPSLSHPDADALDRAAGLIAAAQYPVLLVGLQCRTVEEAQWLRALAESVPAPVLTTYKAKGVFPDSHPLALGVFRGGVTDEAVVRRADLIVAIGLDTVELIPRPWPYSASVIHLARTPHPGHYFVPAVEVLGEIGLIVEELAPRLRRKTQANWDVALVDRLKREQVLLPIISRSALTPHRVVQIARELAPPRSVAAVDPEPGLVPAATVWHAEEPGTFLISHGVTTTGFALPAAIAAQLVYPDRRVLCLTGDSGLMRMVGELETVVRLSLPLVIVVFNDRARTPSPDFSALARSFGMTAFGAASEGELREAVVSALAAGHPALVDARIDPASSVTGHNCSWAEWGNRDDLSVTQ